MARLLKGVVDFYNQTMEHGDPRVNDWSLMQSPWPTMCICFSYVYFVKILGPAFMKDRKPVQLRRIMIFYNFLMVVVSIWLFVSLGTYGWFGKYNWKCEPVDYSDSNEARIIFMVLRKKFSHVTALHVTHHGIMPMSVWWGVKFTPGGHSTFFAFLNSFVHILMYFYYAMAAIGPNMTKYLWWKKYMTVIQMVQFVFIFIHSFQLLFRECNYPRGFMWWIGFHAVLFWFLFRDFYRNAYNKHVSDKKQLVTPCFPEGQVFVNHNGIHKNGYQTKNGYRRTATEVECTKKVE